MATEPGAGPGYRIQALSKGLQVLGLFDEANLTLRLTEICHRTGIPMPTVYRIVATLEADGFLRKRSDGSVEPTLSVLTLGSAALRGSDIVQVSTSPLEQLADETGETVNLGRLTGGQVLYLLRIRNDDLVTANIQVGSSLPAVLTSMGKAMLATLSDGELDELIDPADFTRPHGPNAVANLGELREQLVKIREQGYAVQNEELASGLRSVSVALKASTLGAPTAINLAVAASHRSLEDLLGPLLDATRTTAADIDSRLERL